VKRALIVVLTMTLLGLCSSGTVPALAQGASGAGVRYFVATGHNVQGQFLTFFDRFGGEAILGSPRTEAFMENGLKVQYFQRAKMEYHPYNALAYQVQLALLGDLLGYRTPAIAPLAIPAAGNSQRRYYPLTGHSVCYGFLQYLDTHGGLDVFGYPITEVLMENGTVVQYFQRAKMAWHPENAYGSQITLGNLGDEYITRFGVPASALERVPVVTTPAVNEQSYLPSPVVGGTQKPTVAPHVPGAAGTFTVSVSVKYPITGQGGYQTVYVRSSDGSDHGIANATVQVIVHFRAGDRIVPTPNTDASGNASVTFGIGYQPPGVTVLVDARVTAGGRTEARQTQFIPWW